MQALKMLLRTWRGGQLSLIIWSLVLAVAVVTSVSILAERIERALTAESSSFLAADLVVRSSRAIDPLRIQEAERQQVRGARVLSFASMVYYDANMNLASIKAVETGISQSAFGSVTVNEVKTEENSLLSSRGSVTVDTRTNSILIQDTATKLKEIRGVIDKLDIPVRQAQIEN